MKADPERPEQIAERIVFEEWAYTVSQPAKLIETIAAAIRAERAQTARIREALENLSRYEAEELQDAPGYFLDWADVKAALREAAPEDRSHAK